MFVCASLEFVEQKIKENNSKKRKKKVQYDTKIYCVLSLCFVNED